MGLYDAADADRSFPADQIQLELYERTGLGQDHQHQFYSPFLSKSAFFIFCIHYPLTTFLRPVFTKINGSSDIVLATVYIFSVISITIFCIVTYKMLIAIIPRFMNVITGSRG